jgi:sec-independent protein translocase protein TatA
MPDLGWPEVLIILLVVLLLFGGKKLPEIARGTGKALRIFKAETKGLMSDDDDTQSSGQATPGQPQITQTNVTPLPVDPTAPVEHPRSDTER